MRQAMCHNFITRLTLNFLADQEYYIQLFLRFIVDLDLVKFFAKEIFRSIIVLGGEMHLKPNFSPIQYY